MLSAVSNSIAGAMGSRFGHDAANTCEVRLSDTGELYWIERRGEQLVRHDTAPGTGFWRPYGPGSCLRYRSSGGCDLCTWFLAFTGRFT